MQQPVDDSQTEAVGDQVPGSTLESCLKDLVYKTNKLVTNSTYALFSRKSHWREEKIVLFVKTLLDKTFTFLPISVSYQ